MDQTTQTPSMTVAELDKFVSDLFQFRAEIEGEEDKIKEKNKKLAEMQAKAVTALKELGRDSYKTDAGTISIMERWRVNVPATMEDKKAFFAYLKSKGEEVLWQYATVNANSLTSLFLREWEIAKENGDGMTYKMPGIGEQKLHESLSMRKK